MYQEITLAQDTRCFQRFKETNVLTFDGTMRKKGETFTISPPVRLYYDHKLQKAVSFTFGGQTYYMIVSELHLSQLPSDKIISDE